MEAIIHNKYVNVKTYNFLLQMVLFAGLFLMPFVFWPWARVAYEIPRVWFVCRWIEILLILGLFGFFFKKTVNEPNRLLILTTVFFVVIIITSLLGSDWQKSLWGNYYREDGIVTYFHLFALVVFIALYWEDSWKKVAAYGISLGSLLTSLWSVYLGYRLNILKQMNVPNWQGAIGGFFNQPNFLAGYLLISFPFLFYLLKNSKSKTEQIFWGSALVIQAAAVGLTFSWAAFFGLIIFCLLLVILFTNNGTKRLGGTITLIVFLLIILTFYLRSLTKKGFVAESRTRIYTKVFLGALKRPFFGWGWANVDYTFEAVDWPMKFGRDVYVDKAHSIILEVFATTGILGLVIYLVVISYLLKILWLRIKKDPENRLWWKTLLMVLIIYLFHSQTNVISIGEEIFFWIVLGIASSS